MTDIQARHAPAVLAGRLQLASRWGQPCVGYVLLYRPDPAATAALAEIQQDVLTLEPALLRQPAAQLHSSIAWPLPVSRDFGQPKDEIWRERGADWLAAIAAVTQAAAPMRLRYNRVVVTDAAIIAIAQEPNPVASLRRGLIEALGLPWEICYGSTSIVHTSLLRYREPLADPAALLRRVASMPICVDTQVRELLVIRECRYPTLDYEILRQFPLGQGGAGRAGAAAETGRVTLADGPEREGAA